jgi:hypothetical protein
MFFFQTRGSYEHVQLIHIVSINHKMMCPIHNPSPLIYRYSVTAYSEAILKSNGDKPKGNIEIPLYTSMVV